MDPSPQLHRNTENYKVFTARLSLSNETLRSISGILPLLDRDSERDRQTYRREGKVGGVQQMAQELSAANYKVS